MQRLQRVRLCGPHFCTSQHVHASHLCWLCRGVLQVNIRLCFEEMWAKESAKRSSTSDQRRALKHELARKMKKAADFVRPDMDWPEAKQLMLDNGFSILNDMDARDTEHVRPCQLCCKKVHATLHGGPKGVLSDARVLGGHAVRM